MARSTALALASVLILTSCTGSNQSAVPEADFYVSPGQTFLSRVGDVAGIITDFSVVLVSFNGVLQDSRCPEGVTCVQAGAATILLTVQTTLDLQEIELEVPPSGGAQAEVASEVLVEVGEVRPAAQEGVTIDQINYQAVMRVTTIGSPLPTQ